VKRHLYDVPAWHLLLHREARDLPKARASDSPELKLEDELFDRLYAGDSEPAPDVADTDDTRWARQIHEGCTQLPQFTRLAADCQGDALASALGVSTLLKEYQRRRPPSAEPSASSADETRRTLLQATAHAAQAVGELKDTLEGLEGVVVGGDGEGGPPIKGRSVPLAGLASLVKKLATNDRLRRIAQLAGRFKRIAAAKRRTRVRHGADEIADVSQGADLARLLPAELSRLMMKPLRLSFFRDFLERKTLQYQLTGAEPLGRGPLIVLLDKSGSMTTNRKDEWAAAVTLSLVDHATNERRPYALLPFGGHVLAEHFANAGEPLPWSLLEIPADEHTDIAAALSRALDLIGSNTGPHRRSDVVLLTDGISDASLAPELRRRAAQLGVTIFGVAIDMPAEKLSPWCDTFKECGILSTLDEDLASSLFSETPA